MNQSGTGHCHCQTLLYTSQGIPRFYTIHREIRRLKTARRFSFRDCPCHNRNRDEAGASRPASSLWKFRHISVVTISLSRVLSVPYPFRTRPFIGAQSPIFTLSFLPVSAFLNLILKFFFAEFRLVCPCRFHVPVEENRGIVPSKTDTLMSTPSLLAGISPLIETLHGLFGFDITI